jgi:hypothetical protein
MAWPKGRPRPKKASSVGVAPEDIVDGDAAELVMPTPDAPPPDWRKGALLNVRNYGAEYIVTLYPEEHDPRSPERGLHFTNLGECQAFVSAWYARESHNPLAR